jgi:hypothetical protein
MINIKIHGSGEKIVPMALEWDKNSPKYSKVNSYESQSSKLLGKLLLFKSILTYKFNSCSFFNEHSARFFPMSFSFK